MGASHLRILHRNKQPKTCPGPRGTHQSALGSNPTYPTHWGVTSSKTLKLTEPSFSHLFSGVDNSSYLLGTISPIQKNFN